MATRLLHVVCTPRGLASNTGRVSNVLLEDLQERDDDLCVNDARSVQGRPARGRRPGRSKSKYMLMTGQALDDVAQASWRQIERTIEQFLDHDMYVLTVPMWNFGIPYALKYYIDAIVQPGYLFKYTPEGTVEPLVHGRKMICNQPRGSDYTGPMAAYDYVENYIRTIFGFVGISYIRFFNVQPMDMSLTMRKAAQRDAIRDVRAYCESGEWRPAGARQVLERRDEDESSAVAIA